MPSVKNHYSRDFQVQVKSKYDVTANKYKLYCNYRRVARLGGKNHTVFSAGCLTFGRMCSTVNFKKTLDN